MSDLSSNTSQMSGRDVWKHVVWTATSRLSDEGAKLLIAAVAAGFALLASFSGNTFATIDVALNVLKKLFAITYFELATLLSWAFAPLGLNFLLPALAPVNVPWSKRPITDYLRLSSAMTVFIVSLILLNGVGRFGNNLFVYLHTLPNDKVAEASVRCHLHKDDPDGAMLCAEAADLAANRAKALAEEVRRQSRQ